MLTCIVVKFSLSAFSGQSVKPWEYKESDRGFSDFSLGD